MGEKEITIAQALRKIKDLKGRIARHSANAMTSVTHKTNAPPAYAFGAEWEQASLLVEEMLELQTRIAIANSKTTVDYEGKSRSLTWCTKKLAEIKGAIAWHNGLQVRAQKTTIEEEFEWAPGASSRARVATEYTCHLPEAERAACVRGLETKFIDLNDLVETENHRTRI
jgi:hypothetical protein